jgi:zinc transporter 9
VSSSRRAVYTALGADLALAFAKLGVWVFAGSSSLLSEAIHSFADSANQAMLAIGMARAQREPDSRHPYGYGRARFVWALLSAVGVLFVGCGVTLAHGVRSLLDPHPVDHLSIAVGILLLALVLESISLVTGLRAVQQRATNRSTTFWTALTTDPDTLSVAVVMEDGAAVLGALVALAALGATWVTGNPVFDALGSIAIGLLLGASALFLAHRNQELLLGASGPPETREQLLSLLRRSAFVEDVKDVKITLLGMDELRLKAEVEFDGRVIARTLLDDARLQAVRDADSDEALRELLETFADDVVDAVGDAVDALEAEIRQALPQAHHVDLEAD